MSKIILVDEKGNEKKYAEVPKDFPIKYACMDFDVPFACEDGICGTCMIDIVDGEENLTELTPQEIDLMRDKKHRLACQCKIKEGLVKIRF